MRRRRESAAWAALTVLAAAALFDVLVALEVVPMGSAPGEEPPGGSVVALAGLAALLVGAGATLLRALDGRGGSTVFALLAPVGAAYLIARWYTFDPYYLPSLRRYADGGVRGAWVVAVTLAAVGAGALTFARPRPGAVASSVVLLVEAATVFVLPLGK